MINVKNGYIEIKNKKFILKPGVTINEFENSDLYCEIVESQNILNYYLKPQIVEDEKFVIIIFFNNQNKIDFINMSILNGEEIPTWESWSEKDELFKKNKHDKWLKTHIGEPPYRYDWGEITSCYDPRSGSSIITIKYN